MENQQRQCGSLNPSQTSVIGSGFEDHPAPLIDQSAIERVSGQALAKDQVYLQVAMKAAMTRTYKTAVNFGLSSADREDLFQEMILDLLERADSFDSSKGSLGTFTGIVSQNRTNDFLNGLMKDRARLCFETGDDADDVFDIYEEAVTDDENIVPLWANDRDLLADSAALLDLETALAHMSDEQLVLISLLNAHGDLPSACRASDLSSATFYRRVADLQMHLRMFGFKTAA